MKKYLSLFAIFMLIMGLAFAESELKISASDPAIRYVGRFSDDFRFGWSGSQIETNFKGSEISAIFEVTNGGNAGITAIVDGKEKVLIVSKEKNNYCIASDLNPDQEHHITLFKRSEAMFGELRFGGFSSIKGAVFSAPPALPYKMLVIGDSITCAYGNEAKRDERNGVGKENGYLSYAPIAARAVNADIMMICWSGRGLFRNRSIEDDKQGLLPELFEQTLPCSAEILWDHSRFVPDLIAINLGTNDISVQKNKKKPLKQEDYTAAAISFIERLRGLYPKSKIILSIGPMAMSPLDLWLQEIAKKFNDVSVLIYPPYAGSDEIGGAWHPSVKKHQEMGVLLAEHIRKLKLCP